MDFSHTLLEQQLVKLYSDATDIFERAKVVAAKEKLDVLKNPTVSYEGQKYYLQSVHTGIKIDVGNEEKVCTDDRITKTAYRLNLTTTDKSEKMVANGLRGLDVLFYRDAEKGLITYATVAMLGGSSERSANIQFELVLTAIRQKYGTPEFIPRWRSSNDQRPYDIILDDIDNLLGVPCDISFFWENTAVAWARNLIIFRGSAFQVLYYDHRGAAQISELRSKAIEDFKKEYYEKKKQTLSQMKQDF